MPDLDLVESPSAARRLDAARRFVAQWPPGTELLLVGGTREAADELARDIALSSGVSFGLHRFSLIQLASRLAAPRLAAAGLAPATALGVEAIAARAAFEVRRTGALRYFTPVAAAPGFSRALARTLAELRQSAQGLARLGTSRSSSRQITTSGSPHHHLTTSPNAREDLHLLAERYAGELTGGGLADMAVLLSAATTALEEGPARFAGLPLLLLDVAIDSDAARRFVTALVRAAPRALATVPAGDAPTARSLEALVPHRPSPVASYPPTSNHEPPTTTDEPQTAHHEPATTNHEPPTGCLDRLRAYLFSAGQAPAGDLGDDLVLFSAPGEGRECVEIARRLLVEADRGTPFDRMAVLVRSPQHYVGLLEHALARGGIPAYFDHGTRRPDPSGRAFLALLGCAVEGLSARRFAEYLSLGQVPPLSEDATPPEALPEWSPPVDEVFGAAVDAVPQLEAENTRPEPRSLEPEGRELEPETRDDAVESDPELGGTLRTPWRWERLLGEAAVIGGRDRWRRRLEGLGGEYAIKLAALKAEEPESPRVAALERDLRHLAYLRAFSLPIIDELAAWQEGGAAAWGEWLRRFEALAPRVLRDPSRVLQVLGDLRPMAAIGPVTLAETRDVLLDRLRRVQEPPPPARDGRVYISTPHRARGRIFDVVFVPGLAERMFPERPREDPLLLDALRRALDDTLPRQDDRAFHERLLLRLALGAARRRVYVSYPRMDLAGARPRVASFYALDLVRAATGRVPPHEELEQAAEAESRASLAWPAPPEPARAIDDLEHDLASLRRLLQPQAGDVRGRAHYLLRLNEFLRESLRDRWERWRDRWTPRDGLVRVIEPTRDALAPHRLDRRPYSPSALQRYAVCPYQFLLSALYRLRPLEEPEPLQRMDPLTRGEIFHRMQAEFFRALARAGPIARMLADPDAVVVLDQTVDRVAAEYHEKLAPAIERVWRDEIAAIRMDLRAWLRLVQEARDAWEPAYFELGFGLEAGPERDPRSFRDPVVIGGRFMLRGSVDLVECRLPSRPDAPPRPQGSRPTMDPPVATVPPGLFRVTDHKTGRDRSRPDMFIGGGAMLQPILYSFAVEQVLGGRVSEARLFYCTTAGNFHVHTVPFNDGARRLGLEALEIIDRAIERGILPPAPLERACVWCDFRPVCGPREAERVARKRTPNLLADLQELRSRP